MQPSTVPKGWEFCRYNRIHRSQPRDPREYKPMMREFWRLFGNLEDRYFRLVDRSSDMDKE